LPYLLYPQILGAEKPLINQKGKWLEARFFRLEQ
jgi:hypothetical protein